MTERLWLQTSALACAAQPPGSTGEIVLPKPCTCATFVAHRSTGVGGRWAGAGMGLSSPSDAGAMGLRLWPGQRNGPVANSEAPAPPQPPPLSCGSALDSAPSCKSETARRRGFDYVRCGKALTPELRHRRLPSLSLSRSRSPFQTRPHPLASNVSSDA